MTIPATSILPRAPWRLLTIKLSVSTTHELPTRATTPLDRNGGAPTFPKDGTLARFQRARTLRLHKTFRDDNLRLWDREMIRNFYFIGFTVPYLHLSNLKCYMGFCTPKHTVIDEKKKKTNQTETLGKYVQSHLTDEENAWLSHRLCQLLPSTASSPRHHPHTPKTRSTSASRNFPNGPSTVSHQGTLSILASLNVLSEPKRALSEPKMLRQLRSQNVS